MGMLTFGYVLFPRTRRLMKRYRDPWVTFMAALEFSTVLTMIICGKFVVPPSLESGMRVFWTELLTEGLVKPLMWQVRLLIHVHVPHHAQQHTSLDVDTACCVYQHLILQLLMVLADG